MAAVEDSYAVSVNSMNDTVFWKNRLDECIEEWNGLIAAWFHAEGYESAILSKEIAKCESRINSINQRLKAMIPK